MLPRKQAKRGGRRTSSRLLRNHEDTPPAGLQQEEHDDEEEDDDKNRAQRQSTSISSHISTEVDPRRTPTEIALRIKELENELLRKELQLLQARPAQDNTKSFKMIDPEKYCGGARELEDYIEALRAAFESHSYQFRDDTAKVNYSIANMST